MINAPLIGRKQIGKGAYALIITAATLWGIISIFIRGLESYGLTALQLVAIRAIISTCILLVYCVIADKTLLKIRLADGKYFIGTGIFSIVFFNWCFFTAIKETSVAVATILLYTAPVFVVFLSRIIFAEKLTKRKIVALGITLAGCSLVTGILPEGSGTVSFYGLMAGFGAGLGYALYSIFGRLALRNCRPITVTFYTFLVAAIVMLPVSGLLEVRTLFTNIPVIAYSIGFAVLCTVAPFICYTLAMTKVETGRAAIVATSEPIVAALVGTIVFGEMLNWWQVGGMALVIIAVTSVQNNA